jgi:hypothetical protein
MVLEEVYGVKWKWMRKVTVVISDENFGGWSASCRQIFCYALGFGGLPLESVTTLASATALQCDTSLKRINEYQAMRLHLHLNAHSREAKG